MRSAPIIFFGLLTLFSCERQSNKTAETTIASDIFGSERSMIRTISFNDASGKIGVEINGDRAFLRKDTPEHQRTEIPYADGLKLLEGFYAIPGVEAYRGKESDNRQISIHYLVDIYDEMPERYSDEWVDYVIPKDGISTNPELVAWFENMRTTKKQAEAEQAGTGQPATRSESKSEGSDKPQPEAEGRSR